MGGVNCGGGVHFERPCHKITDAPDQFVLVDGGCLGANASDLRTVGVQHGGTQQLTIDLSVELLRPREAGGVNWAW
jgi:hypothetical protein